MLGLKPPKFRTGIAEINNVFLYWGAAAAATIFAWMSTQHATAEEVTKNTGAAAGAAIVGGLAISAVSEWSTAVTRTVVTGLVGAGALATDMFHTHQTGQSLFPTSLDRVLPIIAETTVGGAMTAATITPRDAIAQGGEHH